MDTIQPSANTNTNSPHTSQLENKLENKLFHADFQITSVDDVTPPREGLQHDKLVEVNPLDVEANAGEPTDDDAALAMQTWWNDAAKRNLNLRDGYQKVSVLLIKWADNLDELKTKGEVQELKNLFHDRFHYNCTTVELNVKSKPQHQLTRHITTFIEDNDGPQNLLIMYYTGHGTVQDPAGKPWLQLTATANPQAGKGFYKDATANWNKAEKILRSDDVEGDILNIMDCCYSSNIAKSGTLSPRKFELLSACGINQTTCSPGPRSFTRVLIDKLSELADEYTDKPFATHILNERIIRDDRRVDEPSHLWVRLRNPQHIFLAPLAAPRPHPHRLQHLSAILPPRGFLELRFAISRPVLDKEYIERFTKSLADAFAEHKRLGLRRIDWLGFRSTPTTHFERAALAMYACTQWRKLVRRRRLARGERCAPLKRVREEAEGDAGPVKTRRLGDGGMPSPALSWTSRGAEEE